MSVLPLTAYFQLLAALKQPAASAAPTAPAPPPHVTPVPALPTAMSSVSAMQQPGPNPYYTSQPTAPAPYPGAGYMGNLPPPSTAPGGIPPSNPALANLPPNILALLQSAQQQQRPPLPPGQNYGMPINTPPPAAMGSAQQPPGNANPQYQQLMAYLVSLTRYKNSLDTDSTFLSKHRPLRPVENSRLRFNPMREPL